MGIKFKAWSMLGTHCNNETAFLVLRCSFCPRLLIVVIVTEICIPDKEVFHSYMNI